MEHDGKNDATTEVNPAAGLAMRAIVQDRRGPAEVLRSTRIPRPVVADHEVLIRVHAAGVDQGTWHLMTGRPYLMRVIGFGFRNPSIDLAYPLDRVPEAMRHIEAGNVKGKIAITI